MVFSQFSFLFIFLPVFLFIYWLIKREFRNVFLLLASILFYFIGEKQSTWILLAAILINYGFGLLICKLKNDKKVSQSALKYVLWLCVGANLCLLGYYKYANFFINSTNSFAAWSGINWHVNLPPIALPLGISFFTFHALSYVVDIYRGEVKASKSLANVGAYFAMFPQLVAGPILRYNQVSEALQSRVSTPKAIFNGFIIFILGLAQKVLIADPLAVVADAAFALPSQDLTMLAAWLGALAYSFQLFFDFWGYSQMAIGLGMIIGFTFPINFNYPYISSTIQEFWRRWHMTLSFWFRDYVYIPLGGGRVANWRVYFNLMLVFALTGLWHGASYTFIVWGLWHGLFLLIERANPKFFGRLPKWLSHFYTLLVVIVGWVLFRSVDFDSALVWLGHMFGVYGFSGWIAGTQFLSIYNIICFAIAIVFSTPVVANWIKKAPSLMAHNSWITLKGLGGIALFIVCIVKVLTGSFSPFLYFRF
jgi:alginate O-acetyltransferase complex protein AlgI